MKKKIRFIAILCVLVLGLSGCGTSMYELTEDESRLITNYCANMVAKYNRFQDDGITFVVNRTTAEQNVYLGITYGTNEEETAPEEPEEPEETEGDEPVGPVGGSGDEAMDNFEVVSVPMGELMGYPGLDVQCISISTDPEYQEGTYILLTPDDGFVYMVIELSVTNRGENGGEFDFLARSPHFVARTPDGQEYASAGSIILEDFHTFKQMLASGEGAHTVALLQLPQEYYDNYSGIRLSLVVDGRATPVEISI